MSDSLTVTGVRVYEYRMPMKVGFGTSRGVVDQARNLVVMIEAGADGATFRGTGEGVPRGPKITGDTLDGSWSCAVDAAASLEGRRIPIGSTEAALDAIRDMEHELHGVAGTHASRRNRVKPYRGTLAGFDVALLDLVARARRVSVAELLGRRRERVGVSAGTISTVSDRVAVERRTRRVASNFPMSRFKATGDLEEALDYTAMIARANRQAGAEKPVWIDVNEGFSPDDARRYVESVVAAMLDGSLPPHVIVEQPVAKKHTDVLAELQHMADEALSGNRAPAGLRARWVSRRSPSGRHAGPLRLTVIADESMWDADDYRALVKLGGTRGINIKVPKIGGVLPAYDLALEAVRDNPETELYIGGMLGTSDLTAWALHNLARAMPRLDYYTSSPPANVDARIAEPHMRYRSGASRQLIDQVGDGIGADLSGTVIGDYVTRAARLPRPTAQARPTGDVPNRYESSHLARFGPRELGNHLLEFEALRAGLETKRSRLLRFTAVHPETGEQIVFAGTAAASQRATVPTDEAAEPPAAGEPYQLIVVNDRVVSVIHRRAAVVYGDGVSTASDLITWRGEARRGPVGLHVGPLRMDDHVRAELARQGLAWDSVPEPGRPITIRPAGSLRDDGETAQVLSETHQSVLDEAVRAAAARLPGVRCASVDLRLADHRKPIADADRVVAGVSARPAIGPAHFPLIGPPINVAREILVDQCTAAGIALDEPAVDLRLEVTVRGKVQGVGYRHWMRTNADAFGVTASVRNAADPQIVHARIAGRAEPAGALVSLAMKGPRKAKPTSIEVRHTGW